MSDLPLSYPSLQTVLQNMDANWRFRLNAHCPSIRAVEKAVPLKINILKCMEAPFRVNNELYDVQVVPTDQKHCKEVRTDVNLYGEPIYQDIVLEGDIWFREAQNHPALFEYERMEVDSSDEEDVDEPMEEDHESDSDSSIEDSDSNSEDPSSSSENLVPTSEDSDSSREDSDSKIEDSSSDDSNSEDSSSDEHMDSDEEEEEMPAEERCAHFENMLNKPMVPRCFEDSDDEDYIQNEEREAQFWLRERTMAGYNLRHVPSDRLNTPRYQKVISDTIGFLQRRIKETNFGSQTAMNRKYCIEPKFELQLIVSKPFETLHTERVQYDREVCNAHKCLWTFMFKNRSGPVYVRKMYIHHALDAYAIRFPPDIELNINRLSVVGNFNNMILAMEPVLYCDPKVLKLVRLHNIPYDHPILKAADELVLELYNYRTNGQKVRTLDLLQTLKNKTVFAKKNQFKPEDYNRLVDTWLLTGRAIGTKFTSVIPSEDNGLIAFDMIELDNENVVRSDKKLTMRMNSSANLEVSLHSIQDGEYTAWKFKMVVVASDK